MNNVDMKRVAADLQVRIMKMTNKLKASCESRESYFIVAELLKLNEVPMKTTLLLLE